MLKSYQRRAFLLCFLAAAHSAGNAGAQSAGTGLTTRAADTVLPRLPVSAPDLAAPVVVARATAPTGTPTAAPAAEPETLWDVLSRIDRNANAAAAAAAAVPARLPLGAVPGFTLPADPKATLTSKALLGKKRRSPFGALGDYFAALEKATGTSIKAQGSATLSFRQDSIGGGSGAAQAFQQDNYLGRGSNGLYTDANMHIDATLFNSFHYSTDINNNLYSRPDSNKVKIEYKTKSTDVAMGDISAGFQGNSLIDFSRYVSGVEMTNHWSRELQSTILVSRTKAEPQTRVIPGNNSSGPYFVFSGQIVDGSVHVRVDNQDKVQGKDYTLDPISGQLNFLNGFIVLQTSSIAVTYETLGYGQASGGVYGIRTELAPSGGTHFGVTYVTQQSRGSLAGASLTQQFYGNQSPLAAYPLDYPVDTTKPINVWVQDVPQVQGVDFKIDPLALNQIILTHAVPSIQNVKVQYFPLNSNPTPGNRSVLGLDGKVPLGRFGSMTLETALSGLSITGKSVGGQAWQARLNLTPAKNLHTDITLKNIGPSFSSIQSPGFNQNEKSITFSSEYTPIQKLHLTLSWEKAKRPSYAYSGTGVSSQYTVNTNGNDTYDQYTLGASYSFIKNGTISLNRNSFGTTFIAGGKSTSVNDTLSLNYTIGKVGLDAGLTRNNSTSNSIYDLTGVTATGTNYNTTSSTFSKHAGITWNPVRWFRMTGSFSDNDITNSGSGVTNVNTGTGLLAHSNARDTQLTTTFDVSHALKIEYGLSLSDTGNLNNTQTVTGTTATASATGSGSSAGATGTTSTGITAGGTSVTRAFVSFFAPWHLPFAPTRDTTSGTTTGISTSNLGSASSLGSVFGGGINSGLGSTGNYGGLLGYGYGTGYTGASIGGRSLNNHISIAYSPTSRLRTQIGIDQSSSLGDYLYNSKRNSATLGIDYTLSKRMHFNVNYNLQKVAYTGGLGNTSSNTLSFDFEGHPFGGKLNLRLGWQSLRNKSLLNQSALNGTSGSTAAGTAAPLDTSTNLGSYLFHADYPIGNRVSIFLDLADSIATGYQGSSEADTRFGLDYALTQALKFSLGWQVINRQNQDATLSSLNYHTSSLLAEFGLRF